MEFCAGSPCLRFLKLRCLAAPRRLCVAKRGAETLVTNVHHSTSLSRFPATLAGNALKDFQIGVFFLYS